MPVNIGFCLVTVILAAADLAPAEVIYSRETKNTLSGFEQFLEGPLASQNRRGLALAGDGLNITPADQGGFTLFKFKDVDTGCFDLRVRFQIPSGVRYSNSGIYLLYTDPTLPIRGELPDTTRSAYDRAIDAARERSRLYGAGPYEADFFARELQIIAGFEENLPSDNHGAGAFYGVRPVSLGDEVPGVQGLMPYELVAGDT